MKRQIKYFLRVRYAKPCLISLACWSIPSVIFLLAVRMMHFCGIQISDNVKQIAVYIIYFATAGLFLTVLFGILLLYESCFHHEYRKKRDSSNWQVDEEAIREERKWQEESNPYFLPARKDAPSAVLICVGMVIWIVLESIFYRFLWIPFRNIIGISNDIHHVFTALDAVFAVASMYVILHLNINIGRRVQRRGLYKMKFSKEKEEKHAE